MTGKEKCEFLRSIRKDVAEENGIKIRFHKCPHETCATGTCPLCDDEVKKLAVALEKKRAAGEKVVFNEDDAKYLRELQKNSEHKIVKKGDKIVQTGLIMPPEEK